ncbi:hypothetical protein KKB18_02450 [bacterium]|nr:hypothetical protein [bacterium]
MTRDNNIIHNLEYSEDKGLLTFKGIRYLILRPETIMGMYERLREKYGSDVDLHFFQGGFEGGRLSSEKYRDNFGLNEKDLIDFMLKTGGEIGWGKFELAHFDKKKRILDIRVSNSAFVTKDKRTEFPVCHFTLGVMSGMASVLFGSEVSSEEVECVSKGDKSCYFSIKGI